jgi:hypothetical protein
MTMKERLGASLASVAGSGSQQSGSEVVNTSIDPVLELIYILMLNINPIFADNLGEKNAVIKLND